MMSSFVIKGVSVEYVFIIFSSTVCEENMEELY